LGGTAQIAVVGRGGVNERLRGGDAVLVEHGDEHLGVDERAGVEKFHAKNLATGETKVAKLRRLFLLRERRGFIAAPVYLCALTCDSA
jgi:hypothetical protein